MILLHRPVWDLLRVGYCLKIFPENHQEALVSKHFSNSSAISASISCKSVLPSLDVLELMAGAFAPISYASNYRFEAAADLHQKQELGWLHAPSLPAKAQSCYREPEAVGMHLHGNSASERSEQCRGLHSAIQFVLNGSTVKINMALLKWIMKQLNDKSPKRSCK